MSEHDQPADPIPADPSPIPADPLPLDADPDELERLQQALGQKMSTLPAKPVSDETRRKLSEAASRAMQGNVRRLVHGGRCSRPALAFGVWGKRYANLQSQVARYLKGLMTQIEESKGAVSQADRESANAAARYEMACRIIQRTISTDDLSPADRLAHLRQLAHFTGLRLQSVARLKLDAASNGKTLVDDPAAIYGDLDGDDDQDQDGDDQDGDSQE